MSWTRDQRAYFFGCTCVGSRTDQERNLSAAPADEDSDFVDRYCAPNRPGAPGESEVPGTVERLKTEAGLVPIAKARCVINWITELVPHGDHASPGWDWPSDVLPLITVGRMNNRGAISKPRFGLIAKAGHLYFWCDEGSLKEMLDNSADENWRDLHDSVKYFDAPVDCQCGGGDPARASAFEGCRGDRVHPFNAGPVRDLLEKIEGKLSKIPLSKRSLNTRHQLAKKLRPLRGALEEPCSERNEDGNYESGGWDVIYPRLARAFIDAKDSPGFEELSGVPSSGSGSPPVDEPTGDTQLVKESTDLIEKEVDTTKQGLERKKGTRKKVTVPPCKHHEHWFGMVLLNADNTARSLSLAWSGAQDNWKKGCYNTSDIIFMVSGHKVGVEAISQDIAALYCSLNSTMPALNPPKNGHYVYVYHDPAGWNGVFYVGKGTGTRYQSHLYDVFRKIKSQEPSKGTSIAGSAKELRIETYLRDSKLKEWPTYQSEITKRYLDALEQPPGQRNPPLMRIMYEVPFGRMYSNECSQAAEKFFINFQYGVYDLTNRPAGNDPAAFGFLIRPAWYSHFAGEAQRWSQACSYMIDRGRLSALEKTKLDLPYAFQFVGAIDDILRPLGVTPARGCGNDFGHLNAEGAGDFLLRYSLPNRQYGINIRIRRSVPEATLGLCRAPQTSATEFTDYIKLQTGCDVTRPGPDPYFRPFRRCGASDDKGVVFGLDTRPGGPGFTDIDVKPNGTVRHGMTGCRNLNIADAVQEIMKRFP